MGETRKVNQYCEACKLLGQQTCKNCDPENTVVVTVSGGNADIGFAPEHVNVIIIDYDKNP